jgi:hypothetical protein
MSAWGIIFISCNDYLVPRCLYVMQRNRPATVTNYLVMQRIRSAKQTYSRSLLEKSMLRTLTQHQADGAPPRGSAAATSAVW